MELSRRDLGLLLPALAASSTEAQTAALPSKVYLYESLAVRESSSTKSRAIFNGKTHKDWNVECHETELAPGMAPHAPHKHVHVELLFLREGTLEVMIEGKIVNVTPGTVTYIATNEEHGWKNIGKTPARYFVFTLGQNQG